MPLSPLLTVKGWNYIKKLSERNNVKKFWYVSRDPTTVSYSDPKHAFYSIDDAMESAERLCKKTGHDFYIMESVSMVRQSKPPLEWVSVQEPVKNVAAVQNINCDGNCSCKPQSKDRPRDSSGRFVKYSYPEDYDPWDDAENEEDLY